MAVMADRGHRHVRPGPPARPALLAYALGTRLRIATWNVNSLQARQERWNGWLERAAPDVPAPAGDEADRRPTRRSMPFQMRGYELFITARAAGMASRSRHAKGCYRDRS